MLLIRCPHCGPRAETEFTFGGATGVVRPVSPAQASDAQWGEYLHFRDNPRGPHAEAWRHTYGCTEWFHVLRDTATHEILATWALGAARPGGLAP